MAFGIKNTEFQVPLIGDHFRWIPKNDWSEIELKAFAESRGSVPYFNHMRGYIHHVEGEAITQSLGFWLLQTSSESEVNTPMWIEVQSSGDKIKSADMIFGALTTEGYELAKLNFEAIRFAVTALATLTKFDLIRIFPTEPQTWQPYFAKLGDAGVEENQYLLPLIFSMSLANSHNATISQGYRVSTQTWLEHPMNQKYAQKLTYLKKKSPAITGHKGRRFGFLSRFRR